MTSQLATTFAPVSLAEAIRDLHDWLVCNRKQTPVPLHSLRRYINSALYVPHDRTQPLSWGRITLCQALEVMRWLQLLKRNLKRRGGEQVRKVIQLYYRLKDRLLGLFVEARLPGLQCHVFNASDLSSAYGVQLTITQGELLQVLVHWPHSKVPPRLRQVLERAVQPRWSDRRRPRRR